MDEDLINYSTLIDDAMHTIVKKALEIAIKNGLPGEHHFFISFMTNYPGVQISPKLRKKYTTEMTIVLQYQFEDLYVNDNDFGVILSFDNERERVIVPFAALTAFADPSVKFGLQFRHIDDLPPVEQPAAEIKEFITPDNSENTDKKAAAPRSKKPTDNSTANVITLDTFRKK
jgi:uncharacterized protein